MIEFEVGIGIRFFIKQLNEIHHLVIVYPKVYTI